MFVHFNSKLVNENDIECITYDDLKYHQMIHVHYKTGKHEAVEGQEAMNLIVQLDPSALEGEQLKYTKHVWAVHNLIGHPLMQILSWLGLSKLGVRIHDATTPLPLVTK